MADDSDPDRDVLSSLPRTRPSMRSSRRDSGGAKPAAKAPAAEPKAASAKTAKPRGAKAKPAAAKAKPASKAKPAKAKASGAKAKAGARPAAKAAAAKPRAAAEPAAKADDGSPSSSSFVPRGRPSAPRRKVPPAGYAPPREESEEHGGPPNPAEIVTTAVQAGVELTQIGLTVSKQALRSVVDKLPRP